MNNLNEIFNTIESQDRFLKIIKKLTKPEDTNVEPVLSRLEKLSGLMSIDEIESDEMFEDITQSIFHVRATSFEIEVEEFCKSKQSDIIFNAEIGALMQLTVGGRAGDPKVNKEQGDLIVNKVREFITLELLRNKLFRHIAFDKLTPEWSDLEKITSKFEIKPIKVSVGLDIKKTTGMFGDKLSIERIIIGDNSICEYDTEMLVCQLNDILGGK